MKQFKWQIILILAAVVAFFAYPLFVPVTLPGDGFSTLGSDTARAEVIRIIEEGQIDMDGRTQLYQVARVEILAVALPLRALPAELDDEALPLDVGPAEVLPALELPVEA